MPNDGENIPLPVMRPVAAPTVIFASLLVFGKSVSSTNTCGDSVVFGVDGVSGNVMRYKAVRFVTVDSVLMLLASVISK